MPGDDTRSWILTGSPENYAATREHIRKWPAEHWKLPFQGQLRTISGADADLLMERMGATAGARA